MCAVMLLLILVLMILSIGMSRFPNLTSIFFENKFEIISSQTCSICPASNVPNPRARHYEKSSSFTTSCVNFASLYNTQIIRSGGSPHAILELGNLIIPLILRPNHALLYRGTRGEIMEFVSGVLGVWESLDPEERSVDLGEVRLKDKNLVQILLFW